MLEFILLLLLLLLLLSLYFYLLIIFSVKPDSRLYTTLLITCMELSDTQTLERVISHFEKSEVHPDLILTTILAKAYSKLGDVDKALNLWRDKKVKTIIFAFIRD